MHREWPTMAKDVHIAERIMDNYAQSINADNLGLFELVLNQPAKRFDFRLASWIPILAKEFHRLYGDEQGEFVTRQIISRCLIQENTIH